MIKRLFLIFLLAAGLSLIGPGSAQSATVTTDWDGAWVPSDGDVDYIHLDFESSDEVNFFLTNQDQSRHLDLSLPSFRDSLDVGYNNQDHEFTYEDQTLEVAENDKFWMGYKDDDNDKNYIYDFTAKDASYNLEFGDTEVAMSDASPVPTPTSLLLLGAGLVGLMGYRLNSQRNNS